MKKSVIFALSISALALASCGEMASSILSSLSSDSSIDESQISSIVSSIIDSSSESAPSSEESSAPSSEESSVPSSEESSESSSAAATGWTAEEAAIIKGYLGRDFTIPYPTTRVLTVYEDTEYECVSIEAKLTASAIDDYADAIEEAGFTLSYSSFTDSYIGKYAFDDGYGVLVNWYDVSGEDEDRDDYMEIDVYLTEPEALYNEWSEDDLAIFAANLGTFVPLVPAGGINSVIWDDYYECVTIASPATDTAEADYTAAMTAAGYTVSTDSYDQPITEIEISENFSLYLNWYVYDWGDGDHFYIDIYPEDTTPIEAPEWTATELAAMAEYLLDFVPVHPTTEITDMYNYGSVGDGWSCYCIEAAYSSSVMSDYYTQLQQAGYTVYSSSTTSGVYIIVDETEQIEIQLQFYVGGTSVEDAVFYIDVYYTAGGESEPETVYTEWSEEDLALFAAHLDKYVPVLPSTGFTSVEWDSEYECITILAPTSDTVVADYTAAMTAAGCAIETNRYGDPYTEIEISEDLSLYVNWYIYSGDFCVDIYPDTGLSYEVGEWTEEQLATMAAYLGEYVPICPSTEILDLYAYDGEEDLGASLFCIEAAYDQSVLSNFGYAAIDAGYEIWEDEDTSTYGFDFTLNGVNYQVQFYVYSEDGTVANAVFCIDIYYGFTLDAETGEL